MSLKNFGGKQKPFVRGASGNPGGRPSIAKALRANGTTTTEVLARLTKIALNALEDSSASERAREYAHNWLTGYILGKPKETVVFENSEADHGDEDFEAMSDEELDRIIAQGSAEDDAVVH